MRNRAGLLAAVLLFLSLQVRMTAAHGGGQLIAGPVPAGPYLVSVWVNPPQPRAGEPIHLTVGVAAPADGTPVLDAQVRIALRPLTGGAPAVSSEATTDQSVNKLFYETDMEVVEEGVYQATVEVTGSQGDGQLGFELAVQSPSSFSWLLPGLGGLLIVLVIAWRRSRRAAV
jgi:hypothetical protein